MMLPKIIRLIKHRVNIVFVDEACFKSNQIRARYRVKAGDASLKIDKAKIGFKNVALVGAIYVKRRIVALLQRNLLIKTTDFVDFLRSLRTRMKRHKTYVFLGNLQAHHTHIVRNNSFKNNQVHIFNASYSSRHLNPIERLWANAKRQFIKDCVTNADFRMQE